MYSVFKDLAPDAVRVHDHVSLAVSPADDGVWLGASFTRNGVHCELETNDITRPKKAPTLSGRGLFRGEEIPARLELHLDHRLVLLVGARRIERDVCGLVARADQPTVKKISFELFAADVREHTAIDNHAR